VHPRGCRADVDTRRDALTRNQTAGQKDLIVYVTERLSFAKRWSKEKRVWHYAIIDWSDSMGNCGYQVSVVIELVPEGLRARPLLQGEVWYSAQIFDLGGARARLRRMIQCAAWIKYDALGNNCESFARWIAFGRRESHQVASGLLFAGLTTCAVAALSQPQTPRRASRRRY
jgi:hypothetical protein